MRTIGHIEHPRLKITLMQHGRYLLKLEDQDVEVVYRFREGEGLESLVDAERLLASGLLSEAEHTLASMLTTRRKYLKISDADGQDFPDII